MRFEHLVDHFAARPFFELREVLALTDDRPKSLKNQLSQWVRGGKVVRLRRGKYLLANPYRHGMPSVYFLSNALQRPSYVSRQTALHYHGMIPEAVAQIQAVSPKHGNTWETKLGTFTYSTIKQARFWGYAQHASPETAVSQNQFFMARPEKALLDLFYQETGEWSEERIEALRLGNLDELQHDVLSEYVERYDSPKIRRASQNLRSLYFEAVS